MKTLRGTIISISEEEIKEAVLGLLYKQKPDLRPSGVSRPQDPNIEFVMGKNGVEARVDLGELV